MDKKRMVFCVKRRKEYEACERNGLPRTLIARLFKFFCVVQKNRKKNRYVNIRTSAMHATNLDRRIVTDSHVCASCGELGNGKVPKCSACDFADYFEYWCEECRDNDYKMDPMVMLCVHCDEYFCYGCGSDGGHFEECEEKHAPKSACLGCGATARLFECCEIDCSNERCKACCFDNDKTYSLHCSKRCTLLNTWGPAYDSSKHDAMATWRGNRCVDYKTSMRSGKKRQRPTEATSEKTAERRGASDFFGAPFTTSRSGAETRVSERRIQQARARQVAANRYRDFDIRGSLEDGEVRDERTESAQTIPSASGTSETPGTPEHVTLAAAMRMDRDCAKAAEHLAVDGLSKYAIMCLMVRCYLHQRYNVPLPANFTGKGEFARLNRIDDLHERF